MAKKKRKNSNYKTKLQDRIEAQAEKTEDVDYVPGPRQRYTEEQLEVMTSDLHFSQEQMKRVANLTVKYPGLTLHDITRIAAKLTVQYNDALVEKGRAISTESLLRHDMIDLSELTDEELDEIVTTTARERLAANPDDQFYYLIPCFQEGTIMHKRNRIIYYKILDLDVEGRSFTIFLHDHSNVNADKDALYPMKDKYLSGIYGACKLRMLPGETSENGFYDQKCALDLIDMRTFPEIYREITPRQLGWTDLYAQIWRLVILQNSDNVDKKQKARNIVPFANLVHIFTTQVIAANCIMATHKTKAKGPEGTTAPKSKPDGQDDPSRKSSRDHADRKPPERIVHHVGRIRIVSRTRPRRVTKSNARKYRVMEWTRRGHIRKLSSGKTVYIKPSTYRRHVKEPQDGQSGRTPTTIKIHKEDKE